MLHVVCMYVYVNVMANISLMQFFYLHFLDIYTIWKCAGIFLSPLNPASSSRVHSSPYLQKFFQHVWIFILISTTLFVSSRHFFHLRTMQSIASPLVSFYQQKVYLQNQFLSTANIYIYIGRDIYRINHRFSESEWVSE